MPSKFKPDSVDFIQAQLFPANVFDLLPDDHDCYLFDDLIKQIDTSEVDKTYSDQGQKAYHPKRIVGILIYGYSHGVFSSRELEKRCNEDLSFMYIAGKNCPNFRVLSDFRKTHNHFFKDCFKQTVQLALQMKLVSLGHVSLDGSKFKANSSKHKAMSYHYLKAKEEALSAEVDQLIAQANRCDTEEDASYQNRTGYELPEDLKFKEQRLEAIKAAKAALEAREEVLNPGKPIDDKKQISFADTDAHIMGKRGDFDYRYNAQISVDGDHQIIVGQHISQRANDQQEVKQGLESIQDNTGALPDKISLDCGYHSGANLEALKEAQVESYVAVVRGEKSADTVLEASNRRLQKSDFIYDEQTDCFSCPGGQQLRLKRKDKQGGGVYQGDVMVCKSCPYYQRCCQSKTGQARMITTDGYEVLRQEMRDHMERPESKEIYKKRKVIVEPVFGHLKNGGFRGFCVRGKEKVAGEFSLVCIAYNIKKMVKSIAAGLVCPKFENASINGI